MANYVLIVSGQSNAVGRAINPLADPNITSYTFTRVKIWKSGAWENLNPADNTQSNDQSVNNHGLEPYFGYLFEQQFPSDTLYIIKYASGGTGLDSSFTPNWSPPSGTLYTTLRDSYIVPALASAALSGGYTPWGFWWMQGESDTLVSGPSSSYYANLVNLFNTMASDVPATANFKRLIGMVRENSAWTYRVNVRNNQRRYVNDTANAVLIYTDDIADNGAGDTVHYSAQGFLQLAPAILRALTFNQSAANTHIAHKHRRVNATTSNVSTPELLESKIFKDLGTGEILVDTRHGQNGLYYLDDLGNVVRVGVQGTSIGSLYESVYRGAPSLGINMIPNRSFTIKAENEDTTIQLYNNATGTSTSRGVNLALFGVSSGALAGMVQLWNFENNYIRVGTNGTERFQFAKDSCGLKFVGTKYASSDATTLDAYEEGTFTATLIGASAAPSTPVTTTARYTLIGRKIFINMFFYNVNTTGASGAMQVTGCPVAANIGDLGRTPGVALSTNITFSGSGVIPWKESANDVIEFYSPVSGTAWSTVNCPSTTGVYLMISLSYDLV